MAVDTPEEEPDIWSTSFEGKSVVIGLGNPYMMDDAVGIRVANELRLRDLGAGVHIFENQTLELSILWQFRGASKVIVVDALRSGNPPGTVSTYTIAPRNGPMLELPSLHALQLYDMFDLANQAEVLPCPLTIVGVEPENCNPGEGLTKAVSAAIPRAVDAVLRELARGL